MADRTLSFASSFTVTVNGTQVTSPYTLTENCTIVATNPSGDTAALYVNGQTWSYVGSSITITDQNIALSREGREEPAIDPPSLTINYIAAASVPTPDWANCFVKTSAGNKAVEKVWIKQNGQLVTVYDGGGGGAAVNFATDSWETISAACKDGSYKTAYSVGDTKDITLSTGEIITVAIMGFDHDDLSDGSGKAPITVAMENLLATEYRMNATNTNEGGWNESEMRTSTMVTLLSQFPSDLQSVIKQVNKKATAGSQGTAITTSADKLFLFALAELASKSGLENSTGTAIKNNAATYEQEGTQYEYFKNTVGDADIYKSCPALVKKLSNGGGSANYWWLRSPYVSSSRSFHYIHTAGVVSFTTANTTCGVCFGFCIG